jgi:hypothetical protein
MSSDYLGEGGMQEGRFNERLLFLQPAAGCLFKSSPFFEMFVAIIELTSIIV